MLKILPIISVLKFCLPDCFSKWTTGFLSLFVKSFHLRSIDTAARIKLLSYLLALFLHNN